MAGQNSDKILDALKDHLTDENSSLIITTLQLHAPQNLKAIAEIVDKAESTLHRHMTKLRDQDIVIKDTNIDLPGKYYKLHPAVKEYFDNRFEKAVENFQNEKDQLLNLAQLLESDDQETVEKAKEELASSLKIDIDKFKEESKNLEATFMVNKNIQSLILNQMLNKVQHLDLSKENIANIVHDVTKLGGLNHLSTTVTLGDYRDLLEAVTAIVELFQKLDDISKRAEKKIEDNSDAASANHYFYLFSGPLDPTGDIEKDR